MAKVKLTQKQKEKKAEALSHSRPMNVWKVSRHPEVKSVIDHLWSEIGSQGLIKKRGASKFKRHVSVIVLDLYVAYLSDPKLYVTYSRNRNDYGPESRYRNLLFGYTHTVVTIDFLIRNKYVENVIGYRNPDIPGKSKQSRMRATRKLIKLFQKKKVIPGMMERDEDEPVIILRDEEKEPMEFEDTEETKQMAENVRLINKNLERHAILLYITDKDLTKVRKQQRKDSGKGPIDFTRKKLSRVFNNGSFQKGGRFYGGFWQNIPRDYRKYIRINDKDVVELDYSGLHINMLYALEKLPMPGGDVYHLEGYSNDGIFREFVKRLLLIVVNASNRSKARGAIHTEVHFKKTLALPSEIPSVKSKDLFPVMDAFETKHEPIKKYFCTGKGIDLQYLDSQMAEKVMLHFSKRGYAILPVHDSFIIHHGKEEELEEAMGKAFFDMFGSEIKVDLKYNSIIERDKEKPPPPPPEDWTPEYMEGRVDKSKIKDLLAWQKPYSTYWQLLEEHRKLTNPKGPSDDSDVIDIPMD